MRSSFLSPSGRRASFDIDILGKVATNWDRGRASGVIAGTD